MSEMPKREIKVVIENENIDFETARKIAEAIAEYNNKEIKAWWDNNDGDHEPSFEVDDWTDLNEVSERWEETLKKPGVEIEINIDDQYSFYC